MKKVVLFWSGGKDSALALWLLKQNPEIQIVALLTMLDEQTNCANKRGLPEVLVNEQAKLLNIPLLRIYLPSVTDHFEIKSKLDQKLNLLKKSGTTYLSFGDSTHGLKQQEHQKLAQELGFNSLFPLLEKNENELIEMFFALEFKAIVTAINLEKLPNHFLNKEYNREWIKGLPENIHNFGANEEFHTILTFMPGFKTRLNYSKSMAKELGKFLVTQIREA